MLAKDPRIKPSMSITLKNKLACGKAFLKFLKSGATNIKVVYRIIETTHKPLNANNMEINISTEHRKNF